MGSVMAFPGRTGVWTETVGPDAVAGLLGAWRALEADACRIPVSVGLLQAAGRLEDRDLRVIAIHDDDGLVAVWPLGLERVGPARVARRLGRDLQPYDGLTLASRACARTVRVAAWQEVRGWDDVDVLRLEALTAGDPLLGTRCAGPWCSTVHRTGRILLDPSRPLLARRSKSRRKSVRRRRRALEAMGAVRLVRATTPEDREDAVRQAILAKRAWLDTKGALGPVVRGEAFLRQLCAVARQPVEDTLLEVFVLEVGGRDVAWEIGHRDGDVHRSFVGAYHPDFANLGVGVALTLEVADWCAGHGLRIYDFLPPLTDFKAEWADHERVVRQVVCPLRARGRLFVPAVRDGRRLAKKAWTSLMPEELAQRLFAS